MDSMQGMELPDIEQWSDRVWVVRGQNPGPFTGPGTNTYLIGTGSRPLLLDTGDGRAAYLPVLERALSERGSDALGELVLTHVHPDHIGGGPGILERFGARPVFKLPWKERDEQFDLSLTAIGDGEQLCTPGATLRAIHTPGHAQDHLCYYLEEERALFTGDVIVGAGTVVIPLDGGSMRLYLRTLEQLLELEIDRIYPGHGPRIERPSEKIQEYLDHRLAREQQVAEAIRSGASTIGGMVERIYVDTPRYLYAAAGQSVHSHLLKLEEERRVSRAIDAAGEEHWSLA